VDETGDGMTDLLNQLFLGACYYVLLSPEAHRPSLHHLVRIIDALDYICGNEPVRVVVLSPGSSESN